MRKYYKLSRGIEHSLAHLAVSLLLSFGVMLFINNFIGSMGGPAAFLSFFVVYYLVRGMVSNRNKGSHPGGVNRVEEVRYLLIHFVGYYLVLWLLIKAINILTKVSGWGKIAGLSVPEYFNQLYGSTMLERWAYLFTALLMFSFVVSLFPLTQFRKKHIWGLYLLADVLLFAVICRVINVITKIFMDSDLVDRPNCVLDDLLLCKLPKSYEAIFFILSVAILLALAFEVVYRISLASYGPAMRKLATDVEKKVLEGDEKPKNKYRLLLFRVISVLGILFVGVGVFISFFVLGDDSGYHKVAEYMSEDTYGPIYYNGMVYIPVELDLDYNEFGRGIGYLASRDQNCESRFYKLTEKNLLYVSNTLDGSCLQLYGDDNISYTTAGIVEAQDKWTKDQVYLLWDEDWYGESIYSKDITGYSTCPASFIYSLENEFGEVSYRPQDFLNYDAYFSIMGYENLKNALAKGNPIGDWVGLILVKDNKFYYGNFDNQITGNLEEQLLDILGGNER